MHYLAAIILDGFYVGNLPPVDSRPLLIQREGRILDANAEAKRRGIWVDMPLAEAQAIVGPEEPVMAWDPELYREAQERWLEVASEFSDTIEPLSQHQALVDLTGHPRPREAAESLRAALSVRLGLRPKVGIAGCRWVAHLAAQRGDPFGLALADPESYVSPLAGSDLPIVPAHAERLMQLGYRTAGEIAALDLATLRAQFDEEALVIARAARGGGDAAVGPLFPPASLASRFAFAVPPETHDALSAASRVLAQTIGAGLRERDAAGRQLDLFLEMEDATVIRHSRTFARAIATTRDLEAALRLLLAEDRQGPPLALHPPLAIRVRMPHLQSTKRVQLDLQGVRAIEDAHMSARTAIENVRQAFGPEVVRLASELPVPRWTQVRRAYARVNGWAWV